MKNHVSNRNDDLESNDMIRHVAQATKKHETWSKQIKKKKIQEG